ncbi:hypothetical protein [uncultured Tenacibaculum sp.]|uniref:hypothetical protein n=1 Tax=uncultured Tenacibaculum sp. TaxID=174713 RepID=UPI0026159227|nr:hypothetical protein [uncultured Tenacibaculum sp.]
MKKEFLKLQNTKILSKKKQRNIQGGIWGSSNCTATGCVARHHAGGNGFVGFEGGPCALDAPTPESCIGTVRNGLCCIGSFN